MNFVHLRPIQLLFVAALLAGAGCDDEPANPAADTATADIASDQTPLEVDASPLDGDATPTDGEALDAEVVDAELPQDTLADPGVDDGGGVDDGTAAEVEAEVDSVGEIDVPSDGLPGDVPDDGPGDSSDDAVADTTVDSDVADVGVDSDVAQDVMADIDADTGGPGATFSVTGGPYAVAPGQESTICVVRNLGNPEAARVAAIHTHLAPGSHHMIVSRVNGNAPTDMPQECFPFDGGIGGSDVLFIAEQPEASLVYPQGAALEINANQLVRIEIHYLNYYPQEIDVTGVVDFELVPPSAGVTSPAEFLFDGSFSLYLPPNQTTTKTSSHFVPVGAHVFALTSHTHKLGVKATIHRMLAGGEQGELLHESLSWADPPLDQFDPPLVFAPGEKLKLTCEYNNTTDNGVSFGLSANDEMCFLWAHYFIP